MARIRKHYGKWQVLYRDPATKRERSIGVFTRKDDATRMKRQLDYQLENGEWQREWKPAVRKAGLDPKLRVHDLRHTAVAMLISQGTYPKDVQEHLGHSSFAVTMDLYGHLYPTARERVADALEDAYRKRSAAPRNGHPSGRDADEKLVCR